MGHAKSNSLMRPLVSLFIVGLSLFCLTQMSNAEVFPGSSKIAQSSVIQSATEGTAQDLIIIFDETAALSKASVMRAAAGASRDTAKIVAAKSAMYSSMKTAAMSTATSQEMETIKDYKRLPAMAVKVKSLSGLQKLAAQSGIKGIYPNRKMKMALTESLPLISQPDAQTAGYIGTGTAVAVIDSGVDYAYAAYPNDFGTCGTVADCDTLPAAGASGCSVACIHDFEGNSVLIDDDGHGTNVGAIVARVAPGTKVLSLDVFNTLGDASESDILAAIDWAIENRDVYNIVAINMSLAFPDETYTSPCSSDSLALPVAEARAAGILSTIATGNDGAITGTSSPACVPAAVSVAAVYDDDIGPYSCDDTTAADQITCFSNNSYYTTLLAPGSAITAGGSTLSGTSMAAPHVAGAIAVLKGDNAFPGESADITVNRMVVSGIPVTDNRDDATIIVKPRLDLSGAISAPTLRILSGAVKTKGGVPVENVVVSVTGPISTTATTDANGIFRVTGLPAGKYTVSPSKLSFTFTPSAKSITIKNKDVFVQFTVRAFKISGNIAALINGVSMADIEISISGCDVAKTAITDRKGKFKMLDLPNCSYTVVPNSSATYGHSFTPDSRAVTVYNKDVKGVNFTSP